MTDVLKGDPVSREDGTVEVQIGFGSDLEELRSSLPRHDHLWFLIGEEDHEGTYQTTDYVQVSVLRDIGGVVEIITPDWIAGAFSRRHFPLPLDGTSFDELVDELGRLVDSSSGATNVYSRRSPSDEPDPNRFNAC